MTCVNRTKLTVVKWHQQPIYPCFIHVYSMYNDVPDFPITDIYKGSRTKGPMDMRYPAILTVVDIMSYPVMPGWTYGPILVWQGWSNTDTNTYQGCIGRRRYRSRRVYTWCCCPSGRSSPPYPWRGCKKWQKRNLAKCLFIFRLFTLKKINSSSTF